MTIFQHNSLCFTASVILSTPNTGSSAAIKRSPDTTPAVRRTPPPSPATLVDGIMAGHESPAPKPKRSLATTAAELQAERDGFLPVWVRAPKFGPEHYTGASRAKLYEWAGDRKIRSVSIREPGQVKGARFFHLGSILDFIARCEAEANTTEETL